MTRLTQIFIAALFISALFMPACNNKTDAGQSGRVTATGNADIGGPFELVDQDGQPFSHQDLLGQPHLVYFGFAYCPDVCPLALQQMGAALSTVDKDASFFLPVFISVDPERDTPKALKSYVQNNGFPKGLIGLTGSLEQIETAKAAYKIYSNKVEDPASAGDYTVDHASLIFLMDETGKFRDVFTHNTTTEEITARLRKFKKSGR